MNHKLIKEFVISLQSLVQNHYRAFSAIEATIELAKKINTEKSCDVNSLDRSAIRQASSALIQYHKDILRCLAITLQLGEIIGIDETLILIYEEIKKCKPEIRAAFAVILGELGSKSVKSIEILKEMSSDENFEVATEVTFSLNRIDTPEAMRILKAKRKQS